jgi:peptidoglycan/LPS O-acetylase OafA/YrhL
VIFCTLLAGAFLIAPVEFQNLATDGLVSSTFISNYLNIHDTGYFDLVGFLMLLISLNNLLFSTRRLLFSSIHGSFNLTTTYITSFRSLAVELQFYLCVPFLFYLFRFLDKSHSALKFCLIGAIALISFALQTIDSVEAAHMQLQNRLWQFCCGFLAYDLHSGELLSMSSFYEKFDDITSETRASKFNINKESIYIAMTFR